MIEFNALAIKVDIDELHAIFLLKKKMTGYHQDNIEIPIHCSTRVTQGVESSNHLGWTRI